MWAWDAYVNIATVDEIAQAIRNPLFNYFETPLQLIPIPEGAKAKNIPSISWNDIQEDVGAARWLPISFGYEELPLSVGGVMPMDGVLIRELQRHEDISIAEYAIWAFYNRKDGRSTDLLIPFAEISGFSKGIRGWAYRLLLKDQPSEETSDFIIHAVAHELQSEDIAARAGLAKAIKNRFWQGLDTLVFEWLEQEADRQVKTFLYEHMVLNAGACTDYFSYLLERYKNSSAETEFRRTVFAAVSKDYSILNSDFGRKIITLNETIDMNGDIVMGGKVTNNVGSIYANVVNLGTMRDAAKDSVYNADHRHLVAPIRDEIGTFIDLLESEKSITDDKKKETVTAITDLAQAEPGKIEVAAERAAKAIKNVAESAKSSAAIVEASQRILEVIRTVF